MYEINELLSRIKNVDMDLLRAEFDEFAEDDEPQPKAARWIFSPIGELLANPQPIDWLVKGWLESDTIAALIAEPGKGKSFLALDMACCVALGKDWHGMPTKQAPVLYLAGEGRMANVRRAMAWSSFYDDLSGAPLHLSAGAVLLNEPDALAVMQGEIDTMPEPPGLLIVDTLQRGLLGDENGPTDMGGFVRALDTLRQRYHCTCLVIHHPSKATPGEPRGHTSFKGAIDSMFTIENRDGVIVLSNPKQRGSDPAAPLAFRFSSQLLPKAWDDEDGNPTQSAVLELDELPDNGAKGRQLSPSLKRALATFHLARGVNTSCDLEAWKGTFYAKYAAETPGAKKQAFRRARQGLLDAGEIRQEGDLYFTNNVMDLLNDADE